MRIKILALAILTSAACAEDATRRAFDPFALTDGLGSDPFALTDEEGTNLTNFDDLDFRVFSGQVWSDVDHSHDGDVIVHWPDGRTTRGLETHIQDLKNFVSFAPDTRIQTHPIRIASGAWTAVTGVMEGTFTEPMVLGDGTVIPPTGRSYTIDMATIGHWENGRMTEEWLFWDNLSFERQIGVRN